MGEKEEVVIEKLNIRKDEFSKQVSVILPKDNQQFEYEATWYKKGGTLRSGRQKSESTILFLDEFEQ